MEKYFFEKIMFYFEKGYIICIFDISLIQK